MKCFKCHKDFLNEGEVTNHLKADHGIFGKQDFNCLQCELPFKNLNVFKEHLKTCKKPSRNLDLHAELDEDCEMVFETIDVETDEGEFEADVVIGDSDQQTDISESGKSEDCEMIETAEDESGARADGITGESDQLKLKLILESWGVVPLYENLIACGINPQNLCYLESEDLYIVLGEDKHLLGYMVKFRHLLRQYRTDLVSNKKESTFVNVLNILFQSDEGKAFTEKYRTLKLDVHSRAQLVHIILKEVFSKGMTPLSRRCLNSMAIQICKIFTKEEKLVYYKKLPKLHPTGVLYTKYINMRHAQLNEEKQAASNSTNNDNETVQEVEQEKDDTNKERASVQTAEQEENDTNKERVTVQAVDEEEQVLNEFQCDAIDVDGNQCSTDSIEYSLKFIKDYTQDCNKDLLLEHWKKTLGHRQERMKEYQDIEEAFAEWPPLKRETGYALLCMDFLLEYGLKASNGLHNWNSFFDQNLATIGKIIKDPIIRRQLNGLVSSTSLEIKNNTIAMALHHLLIPAVRIVNNERWKPPVLTSPKSFMKVVNGEHVMRSEMTKRKNFCKSHGIKDHPVIFEITTCMGTRYNVCIKNVSYKVGSLLEGIDVAFKMFKILNIPFPLECRKVWEFIEHIFYFENRNLSGNFLSIISDLNKE